MLTRPESPANPAPPNALRCHPASQCAAVSAITVAAAFSTAGALRLDYRVHGDPAGLRIPAPATPGPVDGLWQHTCLEAFVAAVDAADYREFNFAPSGQWASYRFTGYRQRDTAFQPAAAPQISCEHHRDGFSLSATLPPELLPAGDTLDLGFSAVMEAADGSMSYWALTHGAAQPDFHLRQSFALTLHRTTP
jgi:hypothetical protein